MSYETASDEAYLISRMAHSLVMARGADGSAARLIHFELAGRYGLAAAQFRDDDPVSWRRAFARGASSFHVEASERPFLIAP